MGLATAPFGPAIPAGLTMSRLAMSALCVSPAVFASKKALQDILNGAGTFLTQHGPLGWVAKHSSEYPIGFSGVVTNHPKRTKFANIRRCADGWVVT